MNKLGNKKYHIRTQVFGQDYLDYWQRCFRFAKSYLHDTYKAEDVASEAMVRLWENLDESYSPLQIKSYLLTVVRSRCLDHLRHEQVSQEAEKLIADDSQRELEFRISLLESNDPQELFATDVQKIFDDTLNSLPERTQQVFRLSRMENKTAREIAAMLHISEKSVEYHISQVLSKMRKSLKDYLPAIIFIYF